MTNPIWEPIAYFVTHRRDFQKAIKSPIKIDRGLVADIVGGERDRIVVKAMIHLVRTIAKIYRT